MPDRVVGEGPVESRFDNPEMLFGNPNPAFGGRFSEFERARALREPVLLRPIPGAPLRVVPGVTAPHGWDRGTDAAARCQETQQEPQWSQLDNASSNWRLVMPFYASALAAPLLALGLLPIRAWARRVIGAAGVLAATGAATVMAFVIWGNI